MEGRALRALVLKSFTLEAQLKPEVDGGGYWRSILHRDGGAGRPGMVPYALTFDDATQAVGFGVTSATLGSYSVRAPFPMDGRSHHVAGVFSNQVMRLYLEGYLVASVVAGEAPASGPMAGVAIGANTIGGFWLRGTLDRVRISDTALVPNQFFHLEEDAAWRAWASLHFGPDFATLPRAQVDADPDLDSATNGEEFRNQTDPGNALSGVKTAIRLAPVITWPSVAGYDYQIHRKPSVTAADWTVIAEHFRATNAVSSFVDAEAPPLAIYRVSVQP
ncbi:MAG: LamG domain-containing protein [Verrucomicrobia bacterium]|nr:LamG domain-containing protein [Verrucomicrobiota bacterium]